MRCREHGTRCAGVCAGDGAGGRQDVAQRATGPGAALAGRPRQALRSGFDRTEQPHRHAGTKYVKLPLIVIAFEIV